MEKSIFSIFVYSFEMLIAFAFFIKNYNIKLKSRFIVILIGLLLFLPCAFLFAAFENEIINLTTFFLINFLFSIICFDITIKAAIIQNIILDAVMFATEILIIFFHSAVTRIPTDLYKSNFTIFLLVTVISKALYLTISQIFSFIVQKHSLDSFKIKYFIPLFIFPVLTIVTNTLFLFISLEFNLSTEYKLMLFIVSILFVFSCIFMFIYYQTLLEKESKISELESEQKINRINSTYMDILEYQNDEFHMMFHDMKNHYLTLSNMESIDDVKKYINELCPLLEDKGKIRISKNKIIDLVLNKYIVICKNNNINFYYEVKTADLNYINNVELSIILNNALDNAIEAAKNSIDKIIEISIRHINNIDIISIINSCDSKPVHQGTILFSTKKHSRNHGYGKKIIERHTKANNGEYEWFYDKKEKRFHLTIIFQSKS